MKQLRTLLSIVIALMVIPMLTAAACNFAIEAAVFNRNTYDAVLEDDVIFEELLAGFLPVVLTIPDADLSFENDAAVAIRIQDIAATFESRPQIWEAVTETLLPPDWLQTTITQLVDVFFGIASGNADALDQEIDVTVVRNRLRGDEAAEAARLIIREAPICSENQVTRFAEIMGGAEGSLPICNPQDDDLAEDGIQAIEQWFNAIGEQFDRDRVTLSDFLDVDRDAGRAAAIVTDLVFNQALSLFFLCPLWLLSLVILLSVRSLKGFSRWIGGVSMTVGVVILLLIVALQVFAFGTITSLITESSTLVDQFIARFTSAFLRSAIGQSSASLLVQSGIFIGFGFILLALAWYLARHQEDEGDVVVITEDGEIISTATQRRIGIIDADDVDDQAPN